MRLKATIETKDRKVRKQLAPIVQIVNEFEGHLNRFYTHGLEWCNDDVLHKARLMALIGPHLGNLEMGCGAGHVWIDTIPSSGRVLLITDAD